ncbi:MAG: molecular chaperone [Ramlibacter sp.]|nr:molecular chaperone [Ramlibacter sp.]
MLRATRRFGVLLCLSAFMAGAGGTGSPLAVSPVYIKLDGPQDHGTLLVANNGETSIGIEVEVVRTAWGPGREVYQPSTDFVLSPPVFRLAGGKSRLLRFRYVGTRTAAENSYRFFVRQIPEEGPPADGTLRFAITLGIPVTVPAMAPHPALKFVEHAGIRGIKNVGNVSLSVKTVGSAGCASELPLGKRLLPEQEHPLAPAPTPAPRECNWLARTDRGDIAISRE